MKLKLSYENRPKTYLLTGGFIVIIKKKQVRKMFKKYNPNPQRNNVGDCVIRSISKVLGYDWERTYAELAVQGFMMCDMPSSNAVWGAYLLNRHLNHRSINLGLHHILLIRSIVGRRKSLPVLLLLKIRIISHTHISFSFLQ